VFSSFFLEVAPWIRLDTTRGPWRALVHLLKLSSSFFDDFFHSSFCFFFHSLYFFFLFLLLFALFLTKIIHIYNQRKEKLVNEKKLGLPPKKRFFRVGNSTISSRRVLYQKGGGQ